MLAARLAAWGAKGFRLQGPLVLDRGRTAWGRVVVGIDNLPMDHSLTRVKRLAATGIVGGSFRVFRTRVRNVASAVAWVSRYSTGVDLLGWGSVVLDPFKRKYCPPGLKVGVGCVLVRPGGPPRGGDPLLSVGLTGLTFIGKGGRC